ncbi:hypothetical protein ACU6U9_15310 [Pseudomonas sp. HK3]
MMRPFHYMLALSVILHCHTSWAEFFGVYSGINQIQHQYLIDTADDKEQTYGASLDMQAYRKQPTGWMARGPKARAQQSTNHIDLDVHASLYQFHTHQGVWLEFEWQKNTLETVIGSNQIYIDESGLAQSLTSGDTVLLERQFLRGQASLGYLKTKLNNYSFKSEDSNGNVITIDKDGRSQAHAPEISGATALNISFTESIKLRLETEYKDTYYFSNSHDQKSESYQLWHAALSYTKGNSSISLHGHNLTDEDYAVKGFYFGNDPRDGYAAKTYTQLAAPRLITIQATQHF